MTFIVVGILMVVFAIGVPIAFSMGFTTVIASILSDIPLSRLPQSMFSSLDSFTLMALPFFIMAGKIMELGGISQRLIGFINSFLGQMRGGLAIVSIVACMLFGAISGSAIATVVAIGSITIPAMIKAGYDRNFAATLMAHSGITGGIIPPSLGLLIYGVAAGTSVGALFIASIVPGILIGISLAVVAYAMCVMNGYGNTAMIAETAATAEKVNPKEIFVAFKDSILALLMPIIVLGGIYGGYFTPTEAAVIAVVYGLIIGKFIYKEINFAVLKEILQSTVVTTASIGLIMATSAYFSIWLVLERIPHSLAEWFANANLSPIVTILLINLFLLLLGTFMEAPAATIITVPILLPLVTGMGVDPIHFGIIMLVNLSIGGLTPPVGLLLFVAAKIGNTKFERLLKPGIPFFIILIVDLILITFLPQITVGISGKSL
ncbi:TRAP transporter large permease [Bacillus sp. X1(2014)]|uniref:TRAP transporter large permease n=1 Tax=Bacillus sp. X1(2014) TaxID=1565991 RepID=UPI0011A46D51|nr:TRAP transporter large permease [Bacillus sp. X1(2014)]